jgi:hypothetical protein
MGSKPYGLPSCFAALQQQTFNLGGDKQDRTADLLHAMQALSQLSYTPINFDCFYKLSSYPSLKL